MKGTYIVRFTVSPSEVDSKETLKEMLFSVLPFDVENFSVEEDVRD